MEYMKDTRKNNMIANFAGTVGKVDATTLELINCCKYVHKDKIGEYVYDAVSFDALGNVTFKRRDLNKK